MKVTYLAHSGFLLEWDHCYWLFDYYKGEIPKLDTDKKLIIFCSHSHRDHFNPAVFSLFKEHPSIEYIFSNECKKALKNEQKKNTELNIESIYFIKAWEDIRISDGKDREIKIHAMHSTDAGAAFYLQYKDKTIYHAGDLHWWVWPGEPEEENRHMTANYKKEMEYLKNKKIDLAFSPLDPRQEEYYDLGLDYLLEISHISYLFPMHFWEDYSIIQKYLSRTKKLPEHTNIIQIEKEGQTWEVK